MKIFYRGASVAVLVVAFILPAHAYTYEPYTYDPYEYVTNYITSVSPSPLVAGGEAEIRGSFGIDETDISMVMVGGKQARIIEKTDYLIRVILSPKTPTGKGTLKVVVKPESVTEDVVVLAAPKISKITPTAVVPGVTRIYVTGSNFGTSEDNWTGLFREYEGSIMMGNVEITRASWADDTISFTVPSEVKKPGSIKLVIQGVKMPSQKYTVLKSGTENSSGEAVTDDPLAPKQYYLNQINAVSAWQTQSSAYGVTVAVIDDGVYVNHPDLRSNIWTNTKEIIGNKKDDDRNGYIDDIYGWDFIDNEGEMSTHGTHGTAVAGIIAAESNNGEGISGIADGAKIMPLIACSSEDCSRKDIIDAIYYAANNGAKVINLSLGSMGTTNYSTDFDSAIRYANAKGVVIVAAAGNGDIEGGTGQNLDQIPVSPACNDNNLNMVIGVSGVDEQGEWVGWSNYGKCVDVVAPAIEITTTAVPVFNDDYFYVIIDGTSFSAPMVSGVAALIISKNPGITPSQVTSAILSSAKNRKNYQNVLGKGMVDASAALAKAQATTYAPATSPVSYSPANTTVSGSFRFTRPLQLGETHPDVLQLQKFLNARGYVITSTGPGSPGNESSYYGQKTKEAVAKFQETYRSEILTPAGQTTGTGNFGWGTIAKVNALLALSQ